MKKYLIFLGALAMVSCKKFLDVNTNPNTPTVTRANLVFSNALNVTAANQVGGVHALGSVWDGMWGHSTSFTGGGQEKTYVFTNGDFNFFDGMYDNLTDYQYVIDHAAADGYGYLVGPAKIMQAYVYQKLVDLYGNIPYSQALKGTAFTYPAYDNASGIYDSLIAKITSGIADVNAATWPVSEASDIFFKGNKTQWVQLGNSLKLRILVRESNVSAKDSYIQAQINAISGGYLADNVYSNPGYTKTSGKLNPFYGNWGYDQNDAQTGNFAYRKMNAVIINWMKNSNDLFRLQRIATPKAGGSLTNPADYTGVPMGSPVGYLEAACSSIGPEQIVKGDAGRASIIMSAAESYFLRAEVAIHWPALAGVVGTAASNYTSGVTWAFRLASATQTGTATATTSQSDAAAAAYLSNGTLYCDFSQATTQANQYASIWIQKWMALCNIDGLEGWSEYRRTNITNASGVVQVTPGTTGVYGNCPYSPRSVVVTGAEPVRLFYTLGEVSVNGANVPTGINVFTSKIFWDVN